MADKRISQLVDRGTVANNDVVPIVVSGATTTNKATISSIQTFMQGNLDLGVTSVGITIGSTGTDVNVTGSPVTSSGNITINLPTASATNRGLLSAADWVTFNSKQDAGNYATTDTTQTITGVKTFSQDIFVNSRRIGRGSGNIDTNTVVGNSALRDNTTGSENSAFGGGALRQITTGSANTAIGFFSMLNSETGAGNVAIGNGTLQGNNGSNNVAVGNSAGAYITGGTTLNTTCLNSVYIGTFTRPSANGNTNEIVIGQNALGNGSNTVTIGNSSTTLNKFFGRVIHADAVNADESATLGQINTTLGGFVTLGTTQTITAQKTFTTSGGDDTLIVNHTSGSGIALDISKAGNGEGLRVIKSSGTGNAMTISGGNFEAGTIVKTGGTSSQFLKADGSVDSSSYLTTGTASSTYLTISSAASTYVTLNTAQTITGLKTFSSSVVDMAIFNSTYATGGVLAFLRNGVSVGNIGNSGSLTVGILDDFEIRSGSSKSIHLRTDAVQFTLSPSGGTATLFSANSSTPTLVLNTTGTNQASGIITQQSGGSRWGFGTNFGSGDDSWNVYNYAAASRFLTIASTGAATFSSSVTANGLFVSGSAGTTGFARFTDSVTASMLVGINSGTPYIHSNNSTLSFGANGSNTFAPTMTLSSGNVGIGTASPSAELEISKAQSTGAVLKLTNPNTENTSQDLGTLGFVSGDQSTSQQDLIRASVKGIAGELAYGTGGQLVFSTMQTYAGGSNDLIERMRITSGGYLKASNTGTYLGAGNSYHELNSDFNTFRVVNISNTNNTSGNGAIVSSLGSNCNNTSSYHYIASTGGADRFYIYGNGNVVNTNNSYGSLSDAKLKDNIEDATPKLDDLMKVKVRNYNLIGDDKKQIGVIAQELEEVFPAMIDESEDYEEAEVPQVDEEGNEILNEEGEVVTTKERVSKGTTTKSVKYSVFVPMLIKAMQEQQEQIKELKTEIDSLKNQIK